jgi:hypothetical protein
MTLKTIEEKLVEITGSVNFVPYKKLYFNMKIVVNPCVKDNIILEDDTCDIHYTLS